MPELPDLQAFSHNLNRKLAGKRLIKINAHKGAKLNVAGRALQKSLEGQLLVKIFREGKELWLTFKNKNTLALHLMLRGKLSWVEKKEYPPNTMLELIFEDRILALTDFQHNARITFNPNQPDVPDAISKKVNPSFWKTTLKSRATIKNLLLNQQIIRGIGNAYADEILWDARISPFSVCDKIPPKSVSRLSRSVKKVLKDAEKKILKEAPDIIGGEIRDFLSIHNAKKIYSPTGALIKKKISGGRKTYYTSEQELFT